MASKAVAMPRSKRSLIGFGIASAILWLGGGVLTGFGLGPWYESLDFPPFQPPGWVFTPAWLVILSLLAVATHQVVQCSRQATGGKTDVMMIRRGQFAMMLYGVQFGLNLGWSLLFFTVQRPDIAFWEILFLDVVVLGMMAIYFRIRASSGWMLVPYFAWLIFATAINGWIAQHNGPFPIAM
ncbi:MAG: TspO/MBR family protein [Planctomycetota bacterium]